jgi:hypothetical protein
VSYLDLLLVHWPESWLPGSDISSGNIQPDQGWTLLDTWWVGELGGGGKLGGEGLHGVNDAHAVWLLL